MEDAVLAGDRRQARRRLSNLSGEDADEVLERMAWLASAGSLLAVELLVELVDDRGIARRAVWGFVVDQTAVDDITQNVLITLAESVTGFRGDARFTTWLHQIARSRSIDYLRQQRDTLSLDEYDQPEDVAETVANVSPAMRMSSIVASDDSVRRLLQRLPGPYREAILLRDVDRLTYTEVAERLGRNVNTVKSHVARGRALLAAVLETGPSG